MMSHAESSKKAQKRAKKDRLAAVAATIQQGNENICISDKGSNSPRSSHPNDEASQRSSTPNADTGTAKKKRGKNKLHSSPLGGCGRFEVEFNERGQLVGENSAKYASHLGSLAQEHVPIIIRDWRLVDSQTRDDLWTLVQQKFLVDECRKDLAIRMMGSYWRQFKSEITSQLVNAAKRNGFKRHLSLIKPINIRSDQEWDAFVKYRHSPNFQTKSSQFSSMRKKQTLLHTMSRKGYARLEHDMRKANPRLSRADVWTKGHLKKNNEPYNDVVADTLVTRRKKRKEKQLLQLQGLNRGSTNYDDVMQSPANTPRRSNGTHGAANLGNERGSGIHGAINLENARCQLLNWCSFDIEEIVAEGKIASTDPYAKVHHVPLGLDCWKVWVDHVTNPTLPLYRYSQEMSMLEQAVGSTTAWPTKFIRLL